MILKPSSFAQSLLPCGGNILFPLVIPNNGYLLRERWMLLRVREDKFNFNFFSKRGNSMSGIEGKVVAITGANSGIGEATALLLAV